MKNNAFDVAKNFSIMCGVHSNANSGIHGDDSQKARNLNNSTVTVYIFLLHFIKSIGNIARLVQSD